MTGVLQEFDDASTRCCWVEDGVRCDKPPAHGGPTTSLCEEHTTQHRALTQEPGAET